LHHASITYDAGSGTVSLAGSVRIVGAARTGTKSKQRKRG
jgi:hypothetical protein